MKQYHLFFSGHVQGVGFRFTTQRLAQGFKVSGYVRNCPDGRVELCIEGDETEIAHFIEDIESHFEGYITSIDQEVKPVTDQFKDFRIIH